jgi:hypothetical protein
MHLLNLYVLFIHIIKPNDIVKQHLLETFFQLEIREMMINKTPIRKWV